MVLLKEPDNEIVIYYKYTFIKRRLQSSIHEVPSGVLSGMDGAQREELPYMKKELSAFVSLSKKLCKANSGLIQKCTAMYVAWEQYLNHSENYKNFEDYLIKNDISY